MSVDREVFEQWITDLDDHFPGERSERVLAVYWKALSERLDTEQFEAACVEILGTREFFPPWRAFVEAAGGDVESEAMEQWEIVREAIKDSRSGLPDGVTPTTRRIVAKMGGLRSLGRKSLDDLPHVERRFRSDYELADLTDARGRELPPMTDKGRALVRSAMEGRLDEDRPLTGESDGR